MSTSSPNITVDAGAIAARLGLTPDMLLSEMRKGLVFQVTEKGEGEDAGRYRVTFRYRAREAVMFVDEDGNPLDLE